MKIKNIYGWLFFIPVALLFLAACDAENEYTNIRANFSFTPVTSSPVLNNALNNPGEYCTITAQDKAYYFQNAQKRTDKVNFTAVNNYKANIMGLGGFIAGKTNIPDPSTGNFVLVSFDRVCPNCDQDYHINKALVLQENGIAYCEKCRRHYDMNNLGIVVDSTGVKLYRYLIAYGNNALVITNR